MMEIPESLANARGALGRDTRVAPEFASIALDFRDGDLTMTGEVATIAAKKLARDDAAAVPGVDHIVDRPRVAPAERMEDGQIRDLVHGAPLQEPALSDCALRE